MRFVYSTKDGQNSSRTAGQHKCHPIATTMPSKSVEANTAIRNFAIRDSIVVACISHLDVNYSPPLSSARAPAGHRSCAFFTSRSFLRTQERARNYGSARVFRNHQHTYVKAPLAWSPFTSAVANSLPSSIATFIPAS